MFLIFPIFKNATYAMPSARIAGNRGKGHSLVVNLSVTEMYLFIIPRCSVNRMNVPN